MWLNKVVEGRDYVKVVSPETGGNGGAGRVNYYGTLTMGKELAMVENNDQGWPCT
jgi:phage anti-repressor protein